GARRSISRAKELVPASRENLFFVGDQARMLGPFTGRVMTVTSLTEIKPVFRGSMQTFLSNICCRSCPTVSARYLQYKDPEEFVSHVFTGAGTFIELARAAEGVIRDLINVFTIAFFHAQKRGKGNNR